MWFQYRSWTCYSNDRISSLDFVPLFKFASVTLFNSLLTFDRLAIAECNWHFMCTSDEIGWILWRWANVEDHPVELEVDREISERGKIKCLCKLTLININTHPTSSARKVFSSTFDFNSLKVCCRNVQCSIRK